MTANKFKNCHARFKGVRYTMNITINGPTFYHEEDENLFFSGIYKLPNFEEVKGVGRELKISFTKDINNEAVMQMLVLCRRWGIEITPLNKFKSELNSNSTLWEKRIEN